MAEERVRGMTLLELMVVLAILGALFGLSLAGFYAWKRRAMHDACLAEVTLRLREARNLAISGAVGSVARVDPAQSTVQAWSFQTVALLGFETAGTAQPRGGAVRTEGEVTAVNGRLGGGVNLSRGAVLVPHAGGFIGREGMALRLYVFLLGRPAAEDETWTIARSGNRFALDVVRDGGVAVRLGTWTMRTAGGVLVPRRWQELALTWRAAGGDDAVAVTVDGCRARPCGPAPPPDLRPFTADAAGTTIRDADGILPEGFAFGPVAAFVDEIEVLAVVPGRSYGVPGEYSIVGRPQAVHFAPSGGLDLRHHDGPVTVFIAPSALIELQAGKGRTAVAGAILPEDLPAGRLSRVTVELSGRIRAEKAGSGEAGRPVARAGGEANHVP
jgi:prepilin-type N-terminal cleavage/methylation domain-containing protein